uniref:Uncharacterized protein n=1 Tax=viral metagenome TaxID=1070528 RepID=A0A6H1ZEQ9_9ZZZZ
MKRLEHSINLLNRLEKAAETFHEYADRQYWVHENDPDTRDKYIEAFDTLRVLGRGILDKINSPHISHCVAEIKNGLDSENDIS